MLAWKTESSFPCFMGGCTQQQCQNISTLQECLAVLESESHFLSSAVVTALPSVLVLTWLFCTCQDHPFSPSHVSLQWPLKYGSSLCQDICLVLLSVEIILKHSLSSLILCQWYFLSLCWEGAWRTLGSISDTSLFVKYNDSYFTFWRWENITRQHLLIKHHLKAPLKVASLAIEAQDYISFLKKSYWFFLPLLHLI